jgi:hypothetical protein
MSLVPGVIISAGSEGNERLGPACRGVLGDQALLCTGTLRAQGLRLASVRQLTYYNPYFTVRSSLHQMVVICLVYSVDEKQLMLTNKALDISFE